MNVREYAHVYTYTRECIQCTNLEGGDRLSSQSVHIVFQWNISVEFGDTRTGGFSSVGANVGFTQEVLPRLGTRLEEDQGEG